MKRLDPAAPKEEQHGDHTVIHPPNTLRAKALTKVRSNPFEQQEMVRRADKALEALSSNFTEWMLSEVKRLTDHFEQFDTGPREVEDYKSLFLVAHDVRGQAMQFGYPIAGQVAAGLCDLLQNHVPVPPVILRRYVEAVSSIVRSGVKDEVNAVALELARQLNKLVADYRRDNTPSVAVR
jgi:hypothetical protein